MHVVLQSLAREISSNAPPILLVKYQKSTISEFNNLYKLLAMSVTIQLPNRDNCILTMVLHSMDKPILPRAPPIAFHRVNRYPQAVVARAIRLLMLGYRPNTISIDTSVAQRTIYI